MPSETDTFADHFRIGTTDIDEDAIHVEDEAVRYGSGIHGTDSSVLILFSGKRCLCLRRQEGYQIGEGMYI